MKIKKSMPKRIIASIAVILGFVLMFGTSAVRAKGELVVTNVDPEVNLFTGTVQEVDREYKHGTKSDYNALLQFKTDKVLDESVEEFSEKLVDWAEKDTDRFQRVLKDILYNDYEVDLSEKELNFIRFAVGVGLAKQEMYYYPLEEGKKYNYDPGYSVKFQRRKESEAPFNAAVSFYYSIHVNHVHVTTIGERWNAVAGFMGEVQKLIMEPTADELEKLDSKTVMDQIVEIAGKYSNDAVQINVVPEKGSFVTNVIYSK